MTLLNDLKEKIRAQLPNLDVVIGWEQGHDALHATPLFIRKPEDVDRLIIGPLCVHNPAAYIRDFGKDKKVGVVVKGCDSRGVIQLLQEQLILKENLTIFGLNCKGVVDLDKIRDRAGELGQVSGARCEPDRITVVTASGETVLPFSEIRADKCATCRFPNALIFDQFIGEPEERNDAVSPVHPSLEAFEQKSPEEKLAFWKQEMSRCVRCYACRNSCPMCVCKDHCIAQSREPQWLSQENSVGENWMFQMIHVMHLMGRCIECGECERACPVGIPLMLLRRKMNQEVRAVFGYDAGVDPAGTLPLMTFKVEEDNIPEREW